MTFRPDSTHVGAKGVVSLQMTLDMALYSSRDLFDANEFGLLSSKSADGPSDFLPEQVDGKVGATRCFIKR